MTKRKIANIGLVLLFLLGLIIMVYPWISQMVYRIDARGKVEEFTNLKQDLNQADIKERIRLARAYNKSVNFNLVTDPYAEELVEGRTAYAKMLEVKELIGHVEIPKLKIDLPIYAGTASDILEKGAGHLEGTSLPVGGKDTHSVITAHRGLPTAELFTNLDKLVEGDIFYIHNIQTVLAYQVDQIKTVEPSDFSEVLVIPDEDYVTLLTCTPYMINSHRLLVRGRRIDYTPPKPERNLSSNSPDMRYKDYLMILTPILLVLLIIWLGQRYGYQKAKREEESHKLSKTNNVEVKKEIKGKRD